MILERVFGFVNEGMARMFVGETGGVVVVGDDGGYVRFHAPHLGSGLRRKDGGGGCCPAPQPQGGFETHPYVTFMAGAWEPAVLTNAR